MLSRLALGRPILTTSILKQAIRQYESKIQFKNEFGFRRFSKETRQETGTRSGQTLKERAMAPPGPNAYGIGKGAAAGASAIGLGALCFYGLGLGRGTSAMDKSIMWPAYVKERINATYLYFGGACIITALSAVAVFSSPPLLRLVSGNGIMSVIGTFAAMIGSAYATQSITYQPGIGPKQFMWALHCAILGAVIAPICFLGGPILIRAAWYTGGVVGGLSTIAICAPSDKFLYMAGPLAIGLGVVFASSLAGMWLPPTTVVGAGLASMSIYGGLIVFGGFLLFDTQRIIRIAELYPTYASHPFDPVNASLSIYMDTLNIFLRIATILGGGGGNRKKNK